VTGLTIADKIELVKAHNYLRQIVARGQAPGQPGATDMLEMYWSEEIAEKANEFADKCVFAHDTNNDRKTVNFPTVGQNLAYAGAFNGDANYNLTYLVELWYDEVELYEGESATVDQFVFNYDTGHYT